MAGVVFLAAGPAPTLPSPLPLVQADREVACNQPSALSSSPRQVLA